MKYALSGLLFFLLFSFLVTSGLFKSIDLNTTIKFQELVPTFFTTPFSVFSILGSAEFAGGIVLLLLLLVRKLNKINVLLYFGVFSIIEILGKSIISQKAPPIEFLKTNIHLFLPASSIPKDFFSYPSGHAARTAFISGLLLVLIWNSNLSKTEKYLFSSLVLAFDVIMFVSRVYLGEHWLTDVIGGLILGYSFAFLSPKIYLKKK